MDIIAQVFARPMGFTAAQDIAVVMLNRAVTEAPANLSVTWAELGIPSGQHMHVRDIVNRKDLPMAVGDFSATVDTHDVAFVRLTQSTQLKSDDSVDVAPTAVQAAKGAAAGA